MATDAPWAGQWIALVFLIIGSLLTFLTTWLQDRRHAQRDLNWRLNERTLEQSLVFVSAAKKIFDLAQPVTDLDFRTTLQECESIVNDMFFASAMLTYVGPARVRNEAQKVFDHCYAISVSKDVVEYGVLQNTLPETIERFNRTVRQACGNSR